MSLTDQNVLVSIVIPAFNEEECIRDTLEAIKKHPPVECYEVIVVDNGSTDSTSAIAKESGAKLVVHADATIASVRNRGVAESSGQVLVFLDADVLVTKQWADKMTLVTQELLTNQKLITGSRCLPTDNGNWFNRHWFYRLAHYEAPYINSGHLITTRQLFDEIGGFSEHLKTAEDYDFCMKAKKSGADIKSNPSLPVIHLGYPQSIKEFVNRERWHGREDFESLASFKASKVGWAAAFNLVLLISSIIALITQTSLLPLLVYFFLMYIVCVALTWYKFSSSDGGALFPTALVFYVYLCGRSLALVDRFTKHGK